MGQQEHNNPAGEDPVGPIDAADAAWTSLEDLAQRSGESVRTIRYYMLNGLLAGPTGQGPAARYPQGHVPRLRLIRRLQDEGGQLSAIRERLAAAEDSEVAAMLRLLDLAPRSGLPEPPKQSSPPSVYSSLSGRPHKLSSEPVRRSQWEHFELEPGVELHVRRPLTTSANRRVQKLLGEAAKLTAIGSFSDPEEP